MRLKQRIKIACKWQFSQKRFFGILLFPYEKFKMFWYDFLECFISLLIFLFSFIFLPVFIIYWILNPFWAVFFKSNKKYNENWERMHKIVNKVK